MYDIMDSGQQAQADAQRAAQMRAYQQSVEGQREMYERSLQQQEQQRRMYDSETARKSQDQKYGVLGGLLSKMGGGPSYGGYGGMGGMHVFSSKRIGGKPQAGG